MRWSNKLAIVLIGTVLGLSASCAIFVRPKDPRDLPRVCDGAAQAYIAAVTAGQAPSVADTDELYLCVRQVGVFEACLARDRERLAGWGLTVDDCEG